MKATQRKSTGWLLIVLNSICLLALLYFVYNGFYHWKRDQGADTSSFSIRIDFKILLLIAVLLPVLLRFLTRNNGWLLQAVLIISVSLFWKADILQSTIFRNQPCSAAKTAAMTKQYMDEKEQFIENNVTILNHLIKDRVPVTNEAEPLNDGMLNYLKKQNSRLLVNDVYTIRGAGIRRGKICYLLIQPMTIKRISFQELTGLYYYPDGDFSSTPYLNHKALYHWNTHLFGVCTTKYYNLQDKWIATIQGGCFG